MQDFVPRSELDQRFGALNEKLDSHHTAVLGRLDGINGAVRKNTEHRLRQEGAAEAANRVIRNVQLGIALLGLANVAVGVIVLFR